MLYVGLDSSRKRVDFDVLLEEGTRSRRGEAAADGDGLRGLLRRLGDAGQPLLAVIESMSAARFVHDELERLGWEVRIADAYRVKGLAPLACKTDRIDCFVLAELARRELIPEIWLPDPRLRGERERTRLRLQLVEHRTASKKRVHSILFQQGLSYSGRDLFGAGGRRLLERLALPEPWASTLSASLLLIDQLDQQIDTLEREIRRLTHEQPSVPLLQSCPGIGFVLAVTIAAELGEISRCASPRKLVGYTGLTPSVEQSGERDRRGPLRKNGPDYPRWAPIEAAHTAGRDPRYRPLLERMRARHGKKRGSKIAAIEIARQLSEAIWHMLTKNQPICSGRRPDPLGRLTAP
jgi:transposase